LKVFEGNEQMTGLINGLSNEDLLRMGNEYLILDEVSNGRAYEILYYSPDRGKQLSQLCKDLRERCLGEGTEGIVVEITPKMAKTYYGVVTNDNVVIKFFKRPEELTQKYGFLQVREQAVLMQDLSKAGITPRVYSYSDDAYVMEKVEGVTLEEYIKICTPQPACREKMIVQYSRTSAYLADKGVYIYDFHTENFMVTNDGRLLLIDVGAARPPGPVSPADLHGYYASKTQAIFYPETTLNADKIQQETLQDYMFPSLPPEQTTTAGITRKTQKVAPPTQPVQP